MRISGAVGGGGAPWEADLQLSGWKAENLRSRNMQLQSELPKFPEPGDTDGIWIPSAFRDRCPI